MKNIKRLGFLLLAVVFVMSTASAQRSNTGTKRSGLTSTGLTNKTISTSINYKTPTAVPDSLKGPNTTAIGYSAIDFDKIDVRCKNLVGQALATYCLENECSESSNTYIIANSLPLTKTIAILNQYTFESPSTSISRQNQGSTYVYNASTVAMCNPYIVNLVEAYLPSHYKIVTDACRDQYASAIDIYCVKNHGCYKMKNFQILEFMKANNTQDYMASITNPTSTTGTKYFFSDYCINKLADKVRLSLVDLYMPDYQEWQKGMCRRSYQNAMSDYCENEGCFDEMSLIMMLNNATYSSLVKITDEGIDCNKELTVETKNTLIEEMVKLANACIREGGQYNASKNQCQWNVILRDDAGKEIDRILFNEGQTIECKEPMFIDPFSKLGRERADKGWIATEEAAKVIATGASGITGGIIGYNVGKNIQDNVWLNKTIKEAVIEGWDSSTNAIYQKTESGYAVISHDSNGNQYTQTVTETQMLDVKNRQAQAVRPEMFTKNQLAKIRNTLQRDSLTFYQMVEQVERDMWNSNVCKKSPTCSATILVRNVFDIKSKTLTSISFKSGDSADSNSMYSTTATLNYAGTTSVDRITFKSTTKYEEKSVQHIDAETNNKDWGNFITALEKKQPIGASELRIIKRIADAEVNPEGANFVSNVLAKAPGIDASDVSYYQRAVKQETTTNNSSTTKTYIDFSNLMIPIYDFTKDRDFAKHSNAGKIIGTTVGAVALGGTAYGVTQLVYNSKYKKVACFTTFVPKNGSRDTRKERKIAEWGKSYTLPKIHNPM